jgi:hypothetical protein
LRGGLGGRELVLMGGRWIGRLLCSAEDEMGAFSFFAFGLRGVLFGQDWSVSLSVFVGLPLCLIANICRSMENVAHVFRLSTFLQLSRDEAFRQ